MNRKRMIRAFVCAGMLLMLASGCRRQSVQELAGQTETQSSETEEALSEEETEEKKNEVIYVYVCGHVNSPGVYKLDDEARVYEAIDMAGGALSDAQTEALNLADVLSDGEKIYVPGKDEEEMSAAETEADDGLININTASESELMTLPGVGEGKAKAIIAYREQQGAFSDIKDILNVSGIGEGIFEQIESLIKVD